MWVDCLYPHPNDDVTNQGGEKVSMSKVTEQLGQDLDPGLSSCKFVLLIHSEGFTYVKKNLLYMDRKTGKVNF